MDEARAKRLTLIACILGSAIVFVDQTVVNVALPALRDDLDATLADQQWVVEAYLLLLASLVLVGGALGDLYGRRRIFAIGVAGFGAASLVCAAAPSIGVLIGARALQGAFGALLVPSSLAIITAVFTGPERARGDRLLDGRHGAAVAFGPPLGGLLVDTLSWRAIFAAQRAARRRSACCSSPAPCRRSRGRGRGAIDVPGVVLCVLGLAGPVYALIRSRRSAGRIRPSGARSSPGSGRCAAFVAYERRRARSDAAAGDLPQPQLRRRQRRDARRLRRARRVDVLRRAVPPADRRLQRAGGGPRAPADHAVLVTLSRRFGALAARVGPRLLMAAGPIVAGLGLLAFARLGRARRLPRRRPARRRCCSVSASR